MTLSDLAADAACAAVTTLLNGGSLRLLDAQGRALAELKFAARAFKRPLAGVAYAHPLEPAEAVRSGEATGYECLTAAGAPRLRGHGGEAPGYGGTKPELVLNSAEIRKGAEVSVETFQYTAKRS